MRCSIHTIWKASSSFGVNLKVNAKTCAHDQVVTFSPGNGIAEEVVGKADLEREAAVNRERQSRDRIKPIIARGCQIRVNIEGMDEIQMLENGQGDLFSRHRLHVITQLAGFKACPDVCQSTPNTQRKIGTSNQVSPKPPTIRLPQAQ